MPLTSVLLFGVTVIGFGAAFSLTNIAVSSVSPVWVAAGRSLIAILALGAYLFLRGRPIVINRTLVTTYIGVGFLTGVIPYTLIAWGQQYIPSSLGGVLFASTPLLTLLFGATLFRTARPAFSAVFGAVVGMGGVAMAIASPVELSASVLQGATATVLAAASYALGGLVVQKHRISDLAAFSAIQLAPATVVLVATALLSSGTQLHHATLASWIALVGLGLIGTGIPLVSLFALVGREGARSASLTTFFIPFVALAIGAGLLGETLSAVGFIGLLVTLFGAYWTTRARH